MPEGDSIWQAAEQLNGTLAGKVLTSTDFRVPRFATLDLSGWTVAAVVPRGKHLLMRLEPTEESDTKPLTIHSHLKMEGSWQIYPPGGRWRKPGHTARCILRTDAADVVGFSLGILEVIPTAEEHKVLGHLGPDILGGDWDPEEATSRILAAPDVAIGVALLDQRNVAGIGNIYRCETCFIAGVHPAMPVSSITDLPLMLDDARRLLQANLVPGKRTTVGVELTPGYLPARSQTTDDAEPAELDAERKHRRSTLLALARSATRDVATVGFRGGSAQRFGQGRFGQGPGGGSYWVYGREGRSCLLCGTPVRRGVLGPASGMEDRDIFFCPSCQPSP